MSNLKAENKTVVVPGEILSSGIDYIPGYGTYRHDKQIICSRLGLLNIDGKVIKIIPISGKYLPKKNDLVIGKIIDILISGWRIEINSPYSAVLSMKDATFEFINKGEDLTRFYDLGEYVVAKIINVTSQNLVDLTMKGPGLRKLKGGYIIMINPTKVPRIIGKKGSMVSMIKQATGCRVIVGQNGLVWIDGEPEKEVIAIETIKKIEKDSHISGLTDTIKEYLEQRTGLKISTEAKEEHGDNIEYNTSNGDN
ncbi:MAG: exosome complex RNA-binding protein Rrp4 [Candidatus Woesearchaeota archaeon]